MNNWKKHSEVSKISKVFADSFPNDIKGIVEKVRKLMIHPCENPYNFDSCNWPSIKTSGEKEKMLQENSIIFGICRNYTLLTVSVLREKGIAARSRCGFATYFDAGKYEDHWVIEYFENGIWKMADAQLNKTLVQNGEFINGAIAWQLFRKYDFAPSLFGFSGADLSSSGVNYIIGNMIRDVSGLLKQELLYSETKNLPKNPNKLTDLEIKFYDEISEKILEEDLLWLEQNVKL